LGKRHPTPGELLAIYSSIQLKLIYLPASKTVKAQVTTGACTDRARLTEFS